MSSGSLSAGQAVWGTGIPSGTSITAAGASGNYAISAPPAIVTASPGTNVLTVTAIHSGTLAVGQTVAVSPSTNQSATIVGLGTGTGGTGTYFVSNSQTVASTQWISSVGTITVSSGGGLVGNTTITGQVTPLTTGEALGSKGRYTISQSQTASTQSMFAISLTLPITSSTAPLTTQVRCYGGSGTNTLTFRYEVMAGQTIADLANSTPIGCPSDSCGIVRQSGGGVMSSVNGTSLTIDGSLLSAGSQVLVDTTAPTAPTSTVFTAGGGTSVANSLGATNTTLTLSATISAGQVGAADYAELFIDGVPFATPITTVAGNLSNTATPVSVPLGTTTNAQMQALIPSGSHNLKLRLYDSASPPKYSDSPEVTVAVNYGP